jgi:myo-inositol catabolism protein IolC
MPMNEERTFSKPKKGGTKQKDLVSLPVEAVEKILTFLYNPYDTGGTQSEVYIALKELLEASNNTQVQHYLEVWERSIDFDTPVERARYFTENLNGSSVSDG